jgi:hypothetical protein
MACLRQSSRAGTPAGFAENTDDLFVGKTLLHGDVLMWLMKTLLTSGCTNQRGAGHIACIYTKIKAVMLPTY